MIDVERTIISQYANSPILIQMIQNMNQYLDPRADFDNFYDIVWNVDTAQGFGLDIWGRIVNVGRYLKIPFPIECFGFEEALPGSYPFNEQPFWDGSVSNTYGYQLSDNAYRKLILTKAMANIAAMNAPSLNLLLMLFFEDRGRCYVNDMGSMTFRYTFEFDLTPVERAIISQSTAFPRPAGVKLKVFNSDLPLFGFSEAGPSAAPFGQGVFVPAGATYEII